MTSFFKKWRDQGGGRGRGRGGAINWGIVQYKGAFSIVITLFVTVFYCINEV